MQTELEKPEGNPLVEAVAYYFFFIRLRRKDTAIQLNAERRRIYCLQNISSSDQFPRRTYYETEHTEPQWKYRKTNALINQSHQLVVIRL
jgi:hypothetical protein